VLRRLADEATSPPEVRGLPQPATSSAGASAAPASVAEAVAAELERREREDAERRESAEYEAFRSPDSQPCPRCGVETCAEIGHDRSLSPSWWADHLGFSCGRCRRELRIGTAGETDDDVRVRAVQRLLGLRALPAAAVAEPHRFRRMPVWWIEHEGAEPAVRPEDRWAHADRAALRAEWDRVASGRDGPDPAAPEIVKGPRCEACGCTDRLVRHVERMGGRMAKVPDRCVDCRVQWLAQASGRVPDWWLVRKGRTVPSWAREFAGAPARSA
jgi:hypothetical protein